MMRARLSVVRSEFRRRVSVGVVGALALVAGVVVVAPVAASVCTSSNEFYYRTGANCDSGGSEKCAYSMGFAPYLPPGGGHFLMMSTGYDMNVYKMEACVPPNCVPPSFVPPSLVQAKAFRFPYSAISKTFWQPSIDSATGYGFAPYAQSASEVVFPSRVFKADPATGMVTDLLEVGVDPANGVGVTGMKLAGIAFSLPAAGGARVVFVGYNEASDAVPNGTLKIKRFDAGPPAAVVQVADLGVFMADFLVIRSPASATIVGLEKNSAGKVIALRSFEITLPGGVVHVAAAPAKAPGAAGNVYFGGLVADEDQSRVYVGSSTASTYTAALEAWDVSNALNPVFQSSVSLPGVHEVVGAAAGGGWVMAVEVAQYIPHLYSFLDPLNPVEVLTANGFPQENPPHYGLLPLFRACMIPDSQGTWFIASGHQETGSWTRLEPSCQSTTPVPSMRIDRAGGALSPTATTCGTYPAADGYAFPGDSLTLVDTSVNTVANSGVVTIRDAQESLIATVNLNQTIGGKTRAGAWTPPVDKSGAYSLFLSVTGNDQATYTKSLGVFVCGQPQLTATTVPASPFAGDTQFNAVADGSPVASTYQWQLGSVVQTSCAGQATCSINLPLGDSTVTATVQYQHQAPAGGPYSASWSRSYTGLDWITFNGVTATQNSEAVPEGGHFRRDLAVTFAFDGSAPATTSYAWSFSPAYAGCAADSTCTVPGSTFTKGPVSATLLVSKTGQSPKSKVLNVIADDPPPISGTVTLLGGPYNVGDLAQIRVAFAGVANPTISVDFGGQDCENQGSVQTFTDCAVFGCTGNVLTVRHRYSLQGTKSVKATITQDTLSVTTSAISVPIGAGTCVTCTIPGTFSLNTPANGATLSSTSVSFVWGASSGAETYDLWIDNLMVKQGIAGFPSWTSTVTQGSHTWKVIARNSCQQSRTSASSSFTVATSAGTLTLAPSKTAVNATEVFTVQVTPTGLPTSVSQIVIDFGGTGTSGHDREQTSGCLGGQCGLPSFSFAYATSGTYSVVARAKDGSGTVLATSSPATITVSNQCSAIVDFGFGWTCGGQTCVAGKDPYVGQAVLLAVSQPVPSNITKWTWKVGTAVKCEGSNSGCLVSFETAGTYAVSATATDVCAATKTKEVQLTVYPDNRPVTADFDAISAGASAMQFTAKTGSGYGDPDTFEWDFGDGKTGTGASVAHDFGCGRPFQVSLTAKRGAVASTTTTKAITVGGTPCIPDSLLVVDVARNLAGLGESLWNTEVRLYNPTKDPMPIKIALEHPKETGRTEGRGFDLLPYEELDLAQILEFSGLTLDNAKASLWFWRTNGGITLPVLSARTHTGSVAPFDDFGQFVNVETVSAAPDRARVLWLMGAQHNGSTAQNEKRGFRTNLTIVNPVGDKWRDETVKLTLLTEKVGYLSVERILSPYTGFRYEQVSLPTLFGVPADVDLGPIIIRIDVAAGTQVAIAASLINNGNNSPIYIPAQASQ